MNILQSIGAFFASVGVAVSSFLGFPQVEPVNPAPEPIVEESNTLGVALPAATAVFETSLAAPITSSATSLTLTANSVRGGGQVSGYTCFTIDEGTAQAETVCGTVSGTSVTSLTRGISQATGTSTVASLQFSHRRGANVKITDFPLIQILKAQANGEDTYPNQLLYATGVTPTNTSALVDKEYVDGLAFSGAGVIDATSIAKGVVELATGAEAAASTASGSSGPLALPGSLATSTFNSATAANRVVVTHTDGLIDDGFIDQTVFITQTSLNATTTGTGLIPRASLGGNYLLATTTLTNTSTNTNAELSIASTTIAANTIGTGNIVKVTIPVTSIVGDSSGTDTITFDVKYGAQEINLSTGDIDNADTLVGELVVYVQGNSATNSQLVSATLNVNAKAVYATNTLTVDSTSSQTLNITQQWNTNESHVSSYGRPIFEVLKPGI